MTNLLLLGAALAASASLLSARDASAFAPPSSTTVRSSPPRPSGGRSSSSALRLSPLTDFASFLLSDDAVADVASAAADVASGAAAGIASGIADSSPSSSAVDAIASTAADAAASSSSSSPSFDPTYSKASYYTTLALYAASFPGLWSQIKRSTKAKVKRKTYVSDGEATEGGKELRQQAGEIMAYMKANNYEVAEAGETITFRGLVATSTSQAFFLTFCTALGMASLALVLQIQFQDVVLPVIGSPNWFYLVLLSPYAGIYYWRSGDRVDDVKVKLASSDDDQLNEITVEGNDEEIDRMWRALELREKGMVRVEGILG